MSMPHVHNHKRLLSCCALLLLLVAGGCASHISTDDLRRDLQYGYYSALDNTLNEVYEDRPVMVNALNLGRFYQFQGEWDKSKKYFDESIKLLEDYEQRAIINVRAVSGKVGAYTFSRASADNFGTGYERSLMHTFNSLNYAMKGNFQGAAVEMRRMEKRQELWLEEAEHRLRARLEEEKKLQVNQTRTTSSTTYTADALPAGYTMGDILRNPELRKVVNDYQDPFSYSLSAIFCRIAGDNQYAQVSLSRACQLDERAYQMFRSVWQRPKVDILKEVASAKRWEPEIMPLPRPFVEGAKSNADTQEVVFIMLSGLGPAMKMEEIRIPYPGIGYIMIDLPSYVPELPAINPKIDVPGGELVAYPLLRTDLLAYRNLRDEIGHEVMASISRAVTRATVAMTGKALASSDEEDENSGSLVGLLFSIGLDLYASSGNRHVRNWELLPARGYLGLAELPRGSSLALTFAGNEYRVDIPEEARGIVVLVSQVEQANLKVDYVTY